MPSSSGAHWHHVYRFWCVTFNTVCPTVDFLREKNQILWSYNRNIRMNTNNYQDHPSPKSKAQTDSYIRWTNETKQLYFYKEGVSCIISIRSLECAFYCKRPNIRSYMQNAKWLQPFGPLSLQVQGNDSFCSTSNILLKIKVWCHTTEFENKTDLNSTGFSCRDSSLDRVPAPRPKGCGFESSWGRV